MPDVKVKILIHSAKEKDSSQNQPLEDSQEIFAGVGGNARAALSTQNEITSLFTSMKKRNHSQIKEMKQKYEEDMLKLNKKYNQVKEQLRVQQELMENRENTEKFLQDQLNKATIETAQLRLLRDELNSSLKQATAQIQYLTRELEKIRVSTARGEFERQQDVDKIREQLAEREQQITSLKNDYQIAQEKVKAEQKQMKVQLQTALKQIDELQDENFQLTNESRKTANEYENEKNEYTRNQQRLADLKLRNDNLSENIIKIREENERLKDIYSSMQTEFQNMTSAHNKSLSEISLLQSQNKSLNDQLKEKVALLGKNEHACQSAEAKLAAARDELAQTKKVEEKIRLHQNQEIENIRNQLGKEKATFEGLREEHQHLIDEFNEQNRELKLEKRLREKAEQALSATRQQLQQAESVMHETESERALISKKLQDVNNLLTQKTEQLDSTEAKCTEALKAKINLEDQLKKIKIELDAALAQASKESIDELTRNLAQATNERDCLLQQNRSYANQFKDMQQAIDRLTSEKESDTQTIESLRSVLKKEREHFKTSITERKTLQEENQHMRQELSNFKREHAQMESKLSLNACESQHMKEAYSQSQAKLSQLIDQHKSLEQNYNNVSQELQEEKSARAIALVEVESLRQENTENRKLINAYSEKEENLRNELVALEGELSLVRESLTAVTNERDVLANDYYSLKNSLSDKQSILLSERQEKEKAIVKTSKLTTKVKTTENVLKNTEQRLREVKDQLSEKTKLLSECQLQLEQLKDMNEQLNSENETLSNSKQLLAKRLQETERQLKDELDVQSEARALVRTEIEQKYDSLLNDKNALIERSAQLETQLKEDAEHILELQEQIQTMKEEAKENQESLSKSLNQVYDYQRQISENEATIQSLKLKNHDQGQLLTQLRDEKKVLKSHVDTSEKKAVAERMQFESMYNTELENMQQKYKNEQIQMQQTIQEQIEKIKAIDQEKSAIFTENRTLRRKAFAIAQKLKNLQQNLETISQQRDQLVEENKSLKTNLVTQVQAFTQLQKQDKKLNKERNKLIEQINSLTTELEATTQERDTMYASTVSMKDAQAQLQAMEARMASMSALNDELQQELLSTKQMRDQTAQEFDDIQGAIQHIHGLLRPGEPLEIDNHSTIFNDQIMKELSVLRDLLISSQNDIESLIQQRDRLTSSVNELKKMNEKLQKTQQKTAEDLAISLSQQEKLSYELQILKDTNEHYDQERVNLNSGLTKLRNALQITKESLSKSESEKQQLKEEKLQLKMRLEQIIDENSLQIDVSEM